MVMVGVILLVCSGTPGGNIGSEEEGFNDV